MIIEVLKTVQFMVNHGFYQSQAELIDIAKQVIQVLNGANDVYKTANLDGTKPIILDPSLPVSKNVDRYFPS